MQLAEIFALAVGSAVWPALAAVVVVALATPRPARLLSFFLAGSLLTTISLGVVIVLLFENSSLETHSRRTVGPAVDLTVGVAAVLVARVVSRGGRAGKNEQQRPARPSWSERTLTRGAPLAFVVGIVLNIIPGVLPLVALKDIGELDYSPGATVALVVAFYLVMFMIVEVPLVGYVVAPVRTAATVARFNDWLRRNGRRVVAVVLYAAGIYLLVRGIAGLSM